MEDLRIAQLITLPKLRVYDAELLIYEEGNPFTPKYKLVDKNTYLGIEVEVENVDRFYQSSPYWLQKEDGSLRNNGQEYVSLPIKAWRAEQALTTLFKDLNSDIDFSDRTSIHVHMNIRTLTLKQLESLIITYIVFERVLFDFIGNNRYNNIFCVPIVETTFGSNLKRFIQDKHFGGFNWQKYTAMNTLPIWEKGTLEFRHLEGTNNIERIILWINFLLSLKVFALQKSPEYIWEKILSLNTTSEYRLFAEEVFKTHMLDLWNERFNKNIAECISYIKTHCIPNEFEYELQYNQEPLITRTPTLNDFIDEDRDFNINELLFSNPTTVRLNPSPVFTLRTNP